MPDKDNNPVTDEEEIRAALRAGWDGKGDVPKGHGMPPSIDESLGNNGIAPTDAERVR